MFYFECSAVVQIKCIKVRRKSLQRLHSKTGSIPEVKLVSTENNIVRDNPLLYAHCAN